jgi:hypothetical protein
VSHLSLQDLEWHLLQKLAAEALQGSLRALDRAGGSCMELCSSTAVGTHDTVTACASRRISRQDMSCDTIAFYAAQQH